MSKRIRSFLVGVAVTAVTAALAVTAPGSVTATAAAAPASTPSGPALTVPKAKLAAATDCDAGARAGRRTVLLVPGTGAKADEVWSWNYVRALPALGLGVCTVSPPRRELGDFTVSAQYAVYAARHAYQVSGHKIAIVGHSQGGLMAVWIAKFWPDVAADTSDVIGLAADVRGTQLGNTLCVARSCSLIAWQMRRGSLVTDAATTAPLPATTSFTSIGSRDDEVVYPEPTVSSYPGVDAIMVQQVCPVHVVEHGGLVADAVAYRLVLDAITHDGGASASRVGSGVCTEPFMPHVDPVTAPRFVKTLTALSIDQLDATHYVSHEPPLPAYAAQYG